MRLLFYFLIFLLTNSLFAQKNGVLSDKEYLKMQDKARVLINSDVDSSLFYANKIEKSNDYLHQSFAVGIKSYLYQLKGDSIKSKQLYKEAFDLIKKVPAGIEKNKTNAYLLNYGGLAEWKRGNYGKALEYYQKGKKQSEELNDLKQVVKFNNNISVINNEVGNYDLAIQAAKGSDKITDKIEYLYDDEQFANSKTQINLNLGNFYEKKHTLNEENTALLDSAEYYYKRAILFSRNLKIFKVSAEVGLANIYYLKKDFNNAKKIYHKLLAETKSDDLKKYFCASNRNLGQVYYNIEEYDNALIYFKKVDSVYHSNKSFFTDFIYSNYFQAKIYAHKKEYDKALKHSRIYLENFEKNEAKLNSETIDVNFNLSSNDLQKDMNDLQKRYKNRSLLTKAAFVFLAILFVLLVLGLIKYRSDKRKTDKKLNELILQYKEENEKKNLIIEQEEANLIPDIITAENIESITKKENAVISIDEIKENEIVDKLKKLEDKLLYLNPDFTQQFVAKKIKTNTTYLSYVVNKRFGKSFSEYSNELKINYVINEMITNPTYRKYSTQAIAESVGFKNAVSFTKSFSKRTGVTPVQFAKKLDSEL
ncbi:MAG TPA: helix-turn-helix domain-containing protein [Flavobacterium sp.]|uniref:helix-turn-helix domain-containing protein n=1 Tax=Flavobacterium sp. TaxID=239 RepID=UPI002BAD31AD|nr:helix-turn-helix domain-containing protein [Flavobacterium sp.]HSD14694.1 helix-turn-helix domain-containing protein [Flavobacterium sp.]